MTRVVVFTKDVVGRLMAGPGIRAAHIAQELARRFPTTLIAQQQDAPLIAGVEAVGLGTPLASTALRSADVVVAQPVREVLALSRGSARMVFDLFDPVVLELRELYGASPSFSQRLHIGREWGRLRMALRRGDLLIAATRAQRDFYAGVEASGGGSSGRGQDRWVDLPFGLPSSPPPPAAPLAPEPTILWGGGIWEWLDPMTAIEGVQIANRRGSRCRLLFLGGRRPNDELSAIVGLSSAVDRAVAASGGTVLRNEEWVPYEERARWVGGSSIAIMLHRSTPEAEYSIRTRLFDALWCGVPVITTAGGFAADLVANEGLGVVVRPGDAPGVAAAIERLLSDDAFRAACVSNAGRVRGRYTWDAVVRPLADRIEKWS